MRTLPLIFVLGFMGFAEAQLIDIGDNNNNCARPGNCQIITPEVPGGPDHTSLVQRTYMPSISQIGCPQCRIEGELVDFLDGYYREVVNASKTEALSASIKRESQQVDTRLDGAEFVDTVRLVPGTYPFARPAIIEPVLKWGGQE